MRHALESLEQRCLLAADLAISMVDNLPEFVVPGDKLALAATVSNQGDTAFEGMVTVQFFAPNAEADDPLGVVATIQKKMKLKPGSSAVVTAKMIANDLPDPGIYDMRAAMTLPEGSDESAENNASTVAGAYDLRLVFGTVGGRRNVSLVTTDADGTMVTFMLKGGGYGEFLAGQDDGDVVLHLADTTSASILAITTKGGDKMTDLGVDIQVDGSLKSIDAKTSNLSGGLNLLGSLGSMVARDVTDFDMGVGSSGPAMNLKMADVANMRLSSVAPIASLTVHSWSWLEDAENPDMPIDQLSRITAPWMLRLVSAGDFSSIVTLSGGGAPGMTLGSAKIGGEFSGEVIALGNVGTFSAALINGGLLLSSGTVANFTIAQAVEATVWAGSIAKVNIGTANNLEVAAGATFTSDQLPAIADGDGSAITWGTGSIVDIKVKGAVGRSRFAAGVNPVNGVLLDDDDQAAGNGAIGRVVLGGTVGDVLFAAVTLPAQVKISGVPIVTAEDGRFMFLEPVS